jgi:hypothetical protein
MLAKTDIESLRVRQLVPFYLMASYLYYMCDESLCVDDAYDLLCRRLDTEWDRAIHPHRSMVKRQYLKQTTGYYIKSKDYPSIVKVAAWSLFDSRRQTAPPTAKRPILRRAKVQPVQEELFSAPGPRVILRRKPAPTQSKPPQVLHRRRPIR